MNKIVSFGALLFSFALVMLSTPPEGYTFTISVSSAYYRVWGIASIVVSLLFLVMAVRTKWSEKAETWLNNRGVYGIWSIIYEGIYILSFLKGYQEVHKASLPVRIDNLIFVFGFILAIYIPFIVSKYYPKKPADKQKTE